ncbi:MAG: hypothetical protein E7444_05875 [Ruminococcaceae bacterium]|nr:hypothetical protein [Oscillospiraceae bacterium]
MKRIICLVIFCVICLSFSGCGNDPVDIFDDIILNIEKMENSNTTSLWPRTEKKLKSLGIVVNVYDHDEIKAEPLDKAFVENYLETHTKEELLSNTLKLASFLSNQKNYSRYYPSYKIDEAYWHKDYEHECACQVLTTLLNLALKYNKIEMNDINAETKNSEGYYTEHPDAEPQPFQVSHDGKFYNSSGENVHTQTRTDRGIVEYYGDYAILSATRYNYDEGRYEWSGGKFYDELPSWTTETYFELYYKGTRYKKGYTKEGILYGNAVDVVDIYGNHYLILSGYANRHEFLNVIEIENN